MCQFASGFWRPRDFAVRIADLNSHSDTARLLDLTDGDKPDDWREFHYLPAGELRCRGLDIDTHTAAEGEAALRARWPTIGKFLTWAFEQDSYVPGDIWLYDLTSAADLPAQWPQRTGGIHLDSLRSAEGLPAQWPQRTGKILLTSLKDPDGLPPWPADWPLGKLYAPHIDKSKLCRTA